MKKLFQLAIPAMILASGVLFNTTTSYAKKEFTVKEKKPCTFCHVAASSKELNEAGKFYKEHKTLEGYKAK